MSAPIWRRLWNALAFGNVAAVDDSGPVLRVQASIGSAEIHDRMPVAQLFGFSGVPPIGSDVLAVFIGGDRANGVICGVNHQATRPTGRAAGETTIFNAFGMSIYMSTAGVVVNGGGMPMTIENSPTVTITAATEIIANTPLFKCSGDIQDNYPTNIRTMATMRSIYDTHTHPDPVSGDTGVPNQTM